MWRKTHSVAVENLNAAAWLPLITTKCIFIPTQIPRTNILFFLTQMSSVWSKAIHEIGQWITTASIGPCKTDLVHMYTAIAIDVDVSWVLIVDQMMDVVAKFKPRNPFQTVIEHTCRPWQCNLLSHYRRHVKSKTEVYDTHAHIFRLQLRLTKIPMIQWRDTRVFGKCVHTITWMSYVVIVYRILTEYSIDRTLKSQCDFKYRKKKHCVILLYSEY